MSVCNLRRESLHSVSSWRVQNNPMEQLSLLQHLPLFQGMSDQTLHDLSREFRVCQFQAGEIIFRQGDFGSTCHVIVRGRVRVFVTGEDGRELSVRILGEGGTVGGMALLEELPRSASVEAVEKTLALELRRDVLISCLQRSPELAPSMLRDLSARLRYATAETQDMASLTVAERLMRRLQQLAEWCGTPAEGGTRITLPLTQQELANLVGASRESVNRALAWR